jgi:hypothetical protein
MNVPVPLYCCVSLVILIGIFDLGKKHCLQARCSPSKPAGVVFVKQHGLDLNPEERVKHSRASDHPPPEGDTLPHNEVDIGECFPMQSKIQTHVHQSVEQKLIPAVLYCLPTS